MDCSYIGTFNAVEKFLQDVQNAGCVQEALIRFTLHDQDENLPAFKKCMKVLLKDLLLQVRQLQKRLDKKYGLQLPKAKKLALSAKLPSKLLSHSNSSVYASDSLFHSKSQEHSKDTPVCSVPILVLPHLAQNSFSCCNCTIIGQLSNFSQSSCNENISSSHLNSIESILKDNDDHAMQDASHKITKEFLYSADKASCCRSLFNCVPEKPINRVKSSLKNSYYFCHPAFGCDTVTTFSSLSLAQAFQRITNLHACKPCLNVNKNIEKHLYVLESNENIPSIQLFDGKNGVCNTSRSQPRMVNNVLDKAEMGVYAIPHSSSPVLSNMTVETEGSVKSLHPALDLPHLSHSAIDTLNTDPAGESKFSIKKECLFSTAGNGHCAYELLSSVSSTECCLSNTTLIKPTTAAPVYSKSKSGIYPKRNASFSTSISIPSSVTCDVSFIHKNKSSSGINEVSFIDTNKYMCNTSIKSSSNLRERHTAKSTSHTKVSTLVPTSDTRDSSHWTCQSHIFKRHVEEKKCTLTSEFEDTTQNPTNFVSVLLNSPTRIIPHSSVSNLALPEINLGSTQVGDKQSSSLLELQNNSPLISNASENVFRAHSTQQKHTQVTGIVPFLPVKSSHNIADKWPVATESSSHVISQGLATADISPQKEFLESDQLSCVASMQGGTSNNLLSPKNIYQHRHMLCNPSENANIDMAETFALSNGNNEYFMHPKNLHNVNTDKVNSSPYMEIMHPTNSHDNQNVMMNNTENQAIMNPVNQFSDAISLVELPKNLITATVNNKSCMKEQAFLRSPPADNSLSNLNSVECHNNSSDASPTKLFPYNPNDETQLCASLDSTNADLPVYCCKKCSVACPSMELFDGHACKMIDDPATEEDLDSEGHASRFLITNVVKLHQLRKFVCHECSIEFRSLRRILYHLPRCQPGPYACLVCSAMHDTRTALNFHVKNMHRRARCHICTECGKTFQRRSSLEKHTVSHHEDATALGPFRCDLCPKKFIRRIYLTNHKLRMHKLAKKFQCQVCGSYFLTQASLTAHGRLLHPSPLQLQRQYPCSHCDKTFTRREKLVLHERRHTGERPYVCGLCGAGFVCQSKLSEHATRQHQPANTRRRHPCPHCDKTYANCSDVKKHVIRVHSVEELSSEHFSLNTAMPSMAVHTSDTNRQNLKITESIDKFGKEHNKISKSRTAYASRPLKRKRQSILQLPIQSISNSTALQDTTQTPPRSLPALCQISNSTNQRVNCNIKDNPRGFISNLQPCVVPDTRQVCVVQSTQRSALPGIPPGVSSCTSFISATGAILLNPTVVHSHNFTGLSNHNASILCRHPPEMLSNISVLQSSRGLISSATAEYVQQLPQAVCSIVPIALPSNYGHTSTSAVIPCGVVATSGIHVAGGVPLFNEIVGEVAMGSVSENALERSCRL